MMKIRIGTALMLCLATASLCAQVPVEITGILKKKRDVVKLFKVAEGKTIEIATSSPAEGGKFGFLFYPEYEGLYVIGTGTALGPNENYQFYLKAGDRLSLTLKDADYELNGKGNSEENLLLDKWNKLSDPIYQKSINFGRTTSTFVDFFPELERIAAQSKIFMAGKRVKNKKFIAAMNHIIKMDMASYATNFLNTPRTVHPSVKEYSPYYASLKAEEFSKHTGMVYSYPWGNRTLSALVSVNIRQQGKKFEAGLQGLKNSLNFISNDTLKGDAVLEAASRYKSFSDYKVLMDGYGQYVVTKAQKKRNLDIMAPIMNLKSGDTAFAFSYPDKDGKIITMADLKGKVVLVDVWATWCGPCKAEIPHLKRLEEEMSGTDVQIVSISVDESKDKEKWLKMIKEEQLGGMQLFASGWGDLAQYYKITGIPRFMVFDRQGNIVTVDAPRPSNPQLKSLLEKILAIK